MTVIELKPEVLRAVKPKSRMTALSGDLVQTVFGAPSDHVQVYYFSASWCGPCRMFTPIMEQLSTEFSAFQFFKLDVDDYRAGGLALELGLTTIPSLIMRSTRGDFYMTGARDIETVREWMTNNL
jgi:thiol-disulfide isomerase/thioredoxin